MFLISDPESVQLGSVHKFISAVNVCIIARVLTLDLRIQGEWMSICQGVPGSLEITQSIGIYSSMIPAGESRSTNKADRNSTSGPAIKTILSHPMVTIPFRSLRSVRVPARPLISNRTLVLNTKLERRPSCTQGLSSRPRSNQTRTRMNAHYETGYGFAGTYVSSISPICRARL